MSCQLSGKKVSILYNICIKYILNIIKKNFQKSIHLHINLCVLPPCEKIRTEHNIKNG